MTTVTMRIRILQGIIGLRELKTPWISLHPGADLYARYEWHLSIAMHLLRHTASLAYVQVLDGKRTVAIIPVITSDAQIACFRRLRVLSLGLHDHLPLADIPLAIDTRIEDIAAALQDALARWPERWDVLRWPRVLATSGLARLARCLKTSHLHIAAAAPCNVLDTQETYGELVAGLSKNLRASLRKSEHRLAEAGGVHIERNGVAITSAQMSSTELGVSGGDGLRDAFDQFLELEASGWKGKAGTKSAIGFDLGLRAFYFELLSQRSVDFCSEVTTLMHNKVAIAAQFSICVGGRRQVLKIGYDESASHFSPGQVLMARVLRAAHDEGLKCISLVTDMPWHQAWRPSPLPTFGVTVFRSRWLSALYHLYSKMRQTTGLRQI